MEMMDYLYNEEVIMRNYRTELLREGEARAAAQFQAQIAELKAQLAEAKAQNL